MSATPRWALVLFLVLLAGPIVAQSIHVPRNPDPKDEKDRLEAKRLFGVGLLHERKSRLLEAVRSFERSLKLNPDVAEVHRALMPLYLALDRTDDAVASARAVMRLDPKDYTTAYIISRQLIVTGRRQEAIDFLKLAAKSPTLADRPDQAAQVHYDLACQLERLDKLAEAEEAIGKVVAIVEKPDALRERTHATPKDLGEQAAEAYERLGQICLKSKKVDEAAAAFEKARKKDPGRAPRLALDLATIYKEQGKPRQALEHLEVYLRSMPSGVAPYEMKIELQKKLGMNAAALADLEAASERDVNNVGLRLLLARELRAARRGLRAEAVYADLLRQNVTPEVYRGLFELCKEQGRAGVQKVLTRLDRAVRGAYGKKDKPGDPSEAAHARAMLTVLRADRSLVRLLLAEALGALAPGKLDYSTKMTLGTLAARANELPAAEKLYRASLRDGGADLGESEAEVYSGLLQVLQLQHKDEAVVELAKQGLAKAHQTNRVLFHRALAYAYLALDRPKLALEAAEAAVTDSGKDQMLGSKKLRVYVLCEVGKAGQALEECRALVKEYNSGGELREARLLLSRTYQALGKLDESEAELDRILELDPTDATVCNDLGYGLADRSKDLEWAERLIRQAIELDRKGRSSGTAVEADAGEDNAAFVDSLGWVLFRRGKLQEARKELERATRLQQSDDPVIWDHLGDVYFRLKEAGKAREAWKRAVALYESGARRKSEPRYKELQDKLRQNTP